MEQDREKDAPPRIEPRRIETGGFRVETVVRTREVPVDELLEGEEVTVERVPVGRVTDTVPPPRQEGETLIIPVVEEELVIERRLVIREEIRVTKRLATRRHQESVPLRAEDLPQDEAELSSDEFAALPSFRKRR